MGEHQKLLTREELAEYWGVAPSTVDRFRRQGLIKSVLPLGKKHRYSPDLIHGLPEAEKEPTKRARKASLKTESKRERTAQSRGRSRICL